MGVWKLVGGVVVEVWCRRCVCCTVVGLGERGVGLVLFSSTAASSGFLGSVLFGFGWANWGGGVSVAWCASVGVGGGRAWSTSLFWVWFVLFRWPGIGVRCGSGGG